MSKNQHKVSFHQFDYNPQIKSTVEKRLPLVGPVISSVGLALDVKEIFESSTPVGAIKIIAGRFAKECLPPALLISGKCIMFAGGVIASASTGGNPLVVSTTISAARSIVKDLSEKKYIFLEVLFFQKQFAGLL